MVVEPVNQLVSTQQRGCLRAVLVSKYPLKVSPAFFACWLFPVLAAAAGATDYSPATNQNFPAQVYWGDTHLHSSWSMDANLLGNKSVSPEEAYRFARGETVTASSGRKAVLSRSLDFLVIADHAMYLGLLPGIRSGSDMPTQVLADLSKFVTKGEIAKANELIFGSIEAGTPLDGTREIEYSTWKRQVELADAYNDPGRFTVLPGYEWTAMVEGNNLHRVVIFREGQGEADTVAPLSTFDSNDPEDLWEWLRAYESSTGSEVFAIPHNGNLSNGLMFSDETFSGEPLSAAYAEKRARWEPLIEVTQIKGDSETHPFLSPNDEFSDFGRFDKVNLAASAAQEPWMYKQMYARAALKRGLALGEQTGTNPFKFGMIGSTDSHTGLASADSDNFWGKATIYEPGSAQRIDAPFLSITEDQRRSTLPKVMSWEQLASGYAAVWATENTREAIFDALLRKEVYASTGPRITVRFFGGWDYPDDTVMRPDYVATGYALGVPMGGDLPARSVSTAPRFVVAALKDPAGANLDRIQVIKGWLDDEGAVHEQVYDVAWSDDRKPDEAGRLPAVGSTVEIDAASYTNTIGTSQLSTVWQDPDFDERQPAFYYLRVLEIPTPRWVLYDKLRLGVQLPGGTPLTHQERAYTSPIWYTPTHKN